MQNSAASSAQSIPKAPETNQTNTSSKDFSKVIDTKQDNVDNCDDIDAEPQANAPFSIFTKSEKYFIVFIAALAAFMSPVTANIYYPAVPTLSKDLNVSVSLINVTITVYLIFQGLAPAFTGSLSDTAGRRKAYIVCFVIYLGANIGLALQSSYAALLVLRCLQSSGSSGTISLANAVVSDIVTSAERGSYISFVTAGALIGPAFGPVIGGALTKVSWRWIFWFLTIISASILLLIVVCLPETCRRLVGNGSGPVSTWDMSLLGYLKQKRRQKDGQPAPTVPKHASARPRPLGAFLLFADVESGLVLLYSGLSFASFYMLVASMPPLLEDEYKLSSLEIGFCYFSTGFGGLTAALSVGRYLNWNFRRHAKRCGLSIEHNVQQDLRNFPIERARLEITFPLAVISFVCILGYGWTMQAHTNLAGPLIFLFFSTFGLSGAFQGLSTLIVDLNQKQPGTATASMNLARCWLGAAGTALVNPLIISIGIGWTSLFIAGASLLPTPILIVVIKYGPGWREKRRLRDQEHEVSQGETV